MNTEVPPLTLPIISMSNFRRAILKEQAPILLACLHQGADYQKQLEPVEEIARLYGATLKVCLAAQEDLGALCKTYQTGTPVFLCLRKGKQKGRLLGQSGAAGLESFLSRFLPDLSPCEK